MSHVHMRPKREVGLLLASTANPFDDESDENFVAEVFLSLLITHLRKLREDRA